MTRTKKLLWCIGSSENMLSQNYQIITNIVQIYIIHNIYVISYITYQMTHILHYNSYITYHMTHILHYNSYIIYNKSFWCIGIAFLLCWIPINAINLLSDFLLLLNMWVVNDTYTKNSNIRGIPRTVANRISRAVLGDKSFGQKWNKGGPNWPNRSKISWMAKSGPKILCQDIALKII